MLNIFGTASAFKLVKARRTKVLKRGRREERGETDHKEGEEEEGKGGNGSGGDPLSPTRRRQQWQPTKKTGVRPFSPFPSCFVLLRRDWRPSRERGRNSTIRISTLKIVEGRVSGEVLANLGRFPLCFPLFPKRYVLWRNQERRKSNWQQLLSLFPPLTPLPFCGRLNTSNSHAYLRDGVGFSPEISLSIAFLYRENKIILAFIKKHPFYCT